MQELLYSFSKKKELIEINPQVYTFLCKHKVVIEKLNYYEWARYLEKVNEGQKSYNLLTKIDESTERNNLSYYRHILEDEFETHTCFYCGKKLTAHNTHVDHFIPWSFIKADNIWNFVLSCNSCNTAKRDNLASRDYLDNLIERNNGLCSVAEDGFQNYTSKRLCEVYKWANENGYSKIWVPRF